MDQKETQRKFKKNFNYVNTAQYIKIAGCS